MQVASGVVRVRLIWASCEILGNSELKGNDALEGIANYKSPNIMLKYLLPVLNAACSGLVLRRF